MSKRSIAWPLITFGLVAGVIWIAASGSDQRKSTVGTQGAEPTKPAVEIGKWAKVKGVTVACPVWDDFEKIQKLAIEHDREAFMNYAWHCPLIDPGTRVYVEDVAILHSAFCVRPAGKPTCSWVPQALVEPEEK
jgi:hypothetical protein